MDQNLTELVVILDKSGSMMTQVNDVIGGFNGFIEEQKKQPGQCRVTLVTFCGYSTTLYEGLPIWAVKPLDKDSYMPSGSTSLLDAVCDTVDKVGYRLAALPESERPGKVITIIITDGEENTSVHYHLKDVKYRIEHQQNKYDWKFIFLGANQDAFLEAGSMGITYAYNFAATPVGYAAGYGTICETVSNYRSTGNLNIDYNDANAELNKTTTGSIPMPPAGSVTLH